MGDEDVSIYTYLCRMEFLTRSLDLTVSSTMGLKRHMSLVLLL